jgi:hypothetical protein
MSSRLARDGLRENAYSLARPTGVHELVSNRRLWLDPVADHRAHCPGGRLARDGLEADAPLQSQASVRFTAGRASLHKATFPADALISQAQPQLFASCLAYALPVRTRV